MKKISEYSSDDDLFFKLNSLIDWQNEMVDRFCDHVDDQARHNVEAKETPNE